MNEQLMTGRAFTSWHPTMTSLGNAALPRVLVVSAHREQARTLGGLLWLGGFEAVGAPDAHSALLIAAHSRPDAVVFDTCLPTREAQILCAVMRRIGRPTPPAMVALGACPTPDDVEFWQQVGADACCAAMPDSAGIVPTIEALVYASQRHTAPRRSLLAALLGAVATHCPELFGHLQRVSALSVRLGRELGLSADALADLEIGALLHDIGKLTVPRELLHRAGPLNPTDEALIHRHPLAGLHILAPAQLSASILAIVYRHHERWDGLGYPNRLAGEEIPLLARIVAVADTFDAMTSRRPYQPTRSADEALANLSAGTGSAWDPAVVAALLDLGLGTRVGAFAKAA